MASENQKEQDDDQDVAMNEHKNEQKTSSHSSINPLQQQQQQSSHSSINPSIETALNLQIQPGFFFSASS